MDQMNLFGSTGGTTIAENTATPPKMNSGMITPEDRIFTVKQIAAIIGFHPMTVYKWIDTLGLPVHRSMRSGRISIVWREFQNWWKEEREM